MSYKLFFISMHLDMSLRGSLHAQILLNFTLISYLIISHLTITHAATCLKKLPTGRVDSFSYRFATEAFEYQMNAILNNIAPRSDQYSSFNQTRTPTAELCIP